MTPQSPAPSPCSNTDQSTPANTQRCCRYQVTAWATSASSLKAFLCIRIHSLFVSSLTATTGAYPVRWHGSVHTVCSSAQGRMKRRNGWWSFRQRRHLPVTLAVLPCHTGCSTLSHWLLSAEGLWREQWQVQTRVTNQTHYVVEWP